MTEKPVGILALQGGYDAHARCLTHLGIPWQLVRTPDLLRDSRGLILPGGESTTHLKLLDRFGLAAPLDDFAKQGNPILATCAGLILASKKVTSPSQNSFGWLDVDVERNGWGRQVHSFETRLEEACLHKSLRGTGDVPLMFIRAPRITRLGPAVEVMARYQGEPIAVKQGNILGMSFHPELTDETRFHRLAFSGD